MLSKRLNMDKRSVQWMGFLMVIAFWFSLLAFMPHPLHLSVAEAHHNKEEKSLQVSVKLFFDDFESALTHKTGQSVFLCPDSSNSNYELVHEYFSERFNLSVNDKLINFDLLGYECENELVFVYLEYRNVAKIKTLSIQNELLFERFLDQTNLLHLYIEEERNTLLTKPKSIKASYSNR